MLNRVSIAHSSTSAPAFCNALLAAALILSNMNFIGYNIISICLIALAAFLIYLGKDGWGWCIFGAIILAVSPSSKSEEKDDVE